MGIHTLETEVRKLLSVLFDCGLRAAANPFRPDRY